MGNPWEMDWETTPEKVDQDASARTSKLDAGYYRVKVMACDIGNEKGELKFKFQVTEPAAAKGRWHFETRDNPRYADNEKEAKMHADKARTWASRLECIPRGTIGKAAPDWAKCVGKEMIIKITVRKWTSADKKTSGEAHEIGWSGLWPLGHEDLTRLDNDIRASVGLPPIAGNDAKAKPEAKPVEGAAKTETPTTAATTPANGATTPTTAAPAGMAADIWS